MKVLVQSPYNRIIDVSDTLTDDRLDACLRENFPRLNGYWKMSDRHLALLRTCQPNDLEHKQYVQLFDTFCDGDLNLDEFSMTELVELLWGSIDDEINFNSQYLVRTMVNPT